MCKTDSNSPFRRLGTPPRVWAVPAIHGEAQRLVTLHNSIYKHMRPGDRLVYTGNYTGYGSESAACINELLTFRRMLLSIPGIFSDHITYLRGRQEEMWQKLLQLQFAPDPVSVLLWMLGNGLSPTLQSYGLSPHDGVEACRYGVTGLAKWTNSIRLTVRKHPGHETLATHLSRAAHTCEKSSYPMLFVHAGLDASKPLEDQGDSLWWRSADFASIAQPYLPFQKVIRGHDPERKGMHMNCVIATIDEGCGFGGALVGVGFEPDGTVTKILEA